MISRHRRIICRKNEWNGNGDELDCRRSCCGAQPFRPPLSSSEDDRILTRCHRRMLRRTDEGYRDGDGRTPYEVLFCLPPQLQNPSVEIDNDDDRDSYAALVIAARQRRKICVCLLFFVAAAAIGSTIAGIVGPLLLWHHSVGSASEVDYSDFYEDALTLGSDVDEEIEKSDAGGGRGGGDGNNDRRMTLRPTSAPTVRPTSRPSPVPTLLPTTAEPTEGPTVRPSAMPTHQPTLVPTPNTEALPECVGRAALHRLEVTGWDAGAITTVTPASLRRSFRDRGSDLAPDGSIATNLVALVTITTPMLGKKRTVVFESAFGAIDGESSTAGAGGDSPVVGEYLCLRRRRCYTVSATLASMPSSWAESGSSLAVGKYDAAEDVIKGLDEQWSPALTWSIRPVMADGSGIGDSSRDIGDLPLPIASGLVLPKVDGIDTEGGSGGGDKENKKPGKKKKKDGKKQESASKRRCTFALAADNSNLKPFCRITCREKAAKQESPPDAADGAEKNEGPMPDCSKRTLLHEIAYLDFDGEEFEWPLPSGIQMDISMNRPTKSDALVYSTYQGTIRDDSGGSTAPPSRYLCLRPDRCYTATFGRMEPLSSPLKEDQIARWEVRRVIRRQAALNGGATLVVASAEVRSSSEDEVTEGLCTFAPAQSKRLMAPSRPCETACMTMNKSVTDVAI